MREVQSYDKAPGSKVVRIIYVKKKDYTGLINEHNLILEIYRTLGVNKTNYPGIWNFWLI